MGGTRVGCVGAAGPGLLAGSQSRNRIFVTAWRASLLAAPWLTALCALCLSLTVVEQVHGLAFRAPTLRAMIETGIALSALAAACLFWVVSAHRRQLRDLLLFGAMLELALLGFASYVLPAAIDPQAPGALTDAPLLGALFMAAAAALAATPHGEKQLAPGRGPQAIAVGAAVFAAGLAELGGVLLHGQLAAGEGDGAHTLVGAFHHPFAGSIAVISAALLIAAAVRMAATGHGRRIRVLLAGGMILFAGARLNYLVVPAPGVDWVTAAEGLRLAAFGLVLAAAIRQEAVVRRAIVRAAATEERRRIARDLHDGLAQDLAFIAAHGARFAGEAGEEHPLAIAARRALAVSRGAIADLAASDAPSVGTALRRVGDELQLRFGVRVAVDADDVALDGGPREDVVRIVREAVVNAAKGQARHIEVSLTRSDERFTLRVVDDGEGISSGEVKACHGFGLKSMRERAVSLGGDMTAHEMLTGGTEVEVVFG